MNQSQVKYARGRAEATYKRRVTALKDSFTVPAVTLSTEERRKALNSRRFNVKNEVRPNAYSLNCFVEFTDETEGSFDSEAFEKAKKVLTKQYETLLDELILGDNQEALKLLREFEGD